MLSTPVTDAWLACTRSYQGVAHELKHVCFLMFYSSRLCKARHIRDKTIKCPVTQKALLSPLWPHSPAGSLTYIRTGHSAKCLNKHDIGLETEQGNTEAQTLPRQVATRLCATVEKVPKMAMAKSTICFTIVCAASATGPSAAPHKAWSCK